MSYRKITVDGKEYEYIVGRTHLKIKTIGLYLVSDIGKPVPGTDKRNVSPAIVAALIRQQKVIKGIIIPTDVDDAWITARALADPDNPPLTAAQLAQLRPYKART